MKSAFTGDDAKSALSTWFDAWRRASDPRTWLEHFRVYAVDVIGQSVKSADPRPSVGSSRRAWRRWRGSAACGWRSWCPRLFRNLQATELLRDSRHCPPTTPAFRSWLAGRQRGSAR
jgi:hypothetical protein